MDKLAKKMEKGRKQSRGSKPDWKVRHGYLVFEDNFSLQIDSYGLRGVFSRVGRVSDVHIPLGKGRKSNRRYEFVRFCKKEDTVRSN